MSSQICPGCRGRNSPKAAACEWCGRPFGEHRPAFGIRWWHIVAALLFGGVILAVVLLAILSASRLDFQSRGAVPPPTPLAAAPTVLLTPAASPPVREFATLVPRPTLRATSTPQPSPTPVPPRYARVVNTNGLGIYLREEPGPQGKRIIPAIAENSLLRVVGPEETVQAQVWRRVEWETRQLEGWVLAQYLQQVDITPTPGRP
ncbi:MAG: hypothetical protein IT305_03560 [Chloroflexi bacterium]|nr:hypothetical protein [Chloroflexota bacterium]